MRILCLHGYRTSGIILNRQMASLQCHVHADFVFINAPFLATGEPDEGIQTYYPNMSYYEWYDYISKNSPDGRRRDLTEAIDFVLKQIKDKGPFDGILGFSQGACMATCLALRKQDEHLLNPVKFVILLGGVPPHLEDKQSFSPIELPSLHIWGQDDFVLEDSKILKSEWYHPDTSMSVIHSGGHHIPTLRSGVYLVIDTWIQEQLVPK